MRIVQGVLLVLLGALGAMFYVKIKGDAASASVQMASLQPPPPPAQQPEIAPAPEPAQPAADEPAPVSAPPVRPARKHPAHTVA